MKSTRTFRLSIRRLFLLTLVSFVAVAALVGIAASANKANRAAKAKAEQAANAKAGINPLVQDKQPQAPTAAVIVATLTDNVAAVTKVAPGGTINYTAVVTNNGAASPADDATNLNYSAPLDANTTLVAGSVHASPIAFNDTYNWVGNTFLDTAARALPAVTANDVAVNAPGGTDTFTLTAIAGGATALGGTVNLASPSGAFTYTPPLGRPNIADGAAVQDSFTYTITSSADPTLTSTGAVRINLTGRVWYLQAGAAGDGRSNTPSGSPAAMSSAADKSTDVFYIFSNAASLNGPFSVDAGQQLLGQGVNLVVNAITLFSVAAPTPTTTNTAGSCVALAGAPGNNTLSGFNIGNCTGGTAITGANVGTLNVSTMTINTNGGALDLTGVGAPTVSVVLGGTTSSSGARNVNLVGLNGTFTLAGGALSGATGNALHVDGGTAGLTYSGTISNSGARQVNIINKTGGTVALSGAIGGTGTGIFLNANNGATLNFTGGIALSTAANAAFTATGPGPAATSGGTINVTQNNTTIVNTLTSTTGTALNVANTTIGASGITFRSISSNGSTNGIILNSTGASGGLTVTGNAGSCNIGTPTCTGGEIRNTTGDGILLTSTNKLSLTRMNIHNNLGNGIKGTTLNGFTLDTDLITNNGNDAATDESGVQLTDLTGTTIAGANPTSITNTTLNENFEFQIQITNNSGTLTDLQMSGNTISSTGAAGTIGNLFNFLALGTANIKLTLTGGTFTGNAPATATGLQCDHSGASGTATCNISGATFTNNNVAVTVSQAQGGNLKFTVSGNTATGNRSHGLNLFVAAIGTGAVDGSFTNNIVGTLGTAGSGSSLGFGIRVQNEGITAGGRAVNVLINGNTVQETASFSLINVFQGINGQTSSTATNATITGNTLRNSAARAIVVQQNNNTDADSAGNTCVDVASNAMSGIPGQVGDGTFIRLRRLDANSAVGDTFRVRQTSSADLATQNSITTAQLSLSGTLSFNGGVCTQPVPIAPPADDTVRNRFDEVIYSHSPMNPMAQLTTELVKLPVATTPITLVSSKVGASSVIAKATTPKASAAEVARIYRSERPLSHHAVRSYKNAFSQEPNAPTSGEIVTLNTIATFPAAGKSVTIKYSATVNTPPLARQVQTQATVTAAGGINVTSTDPGPPVVAGPTVTLIDTTVTWNGSADTNWNTAANWTVPAPGAAYAPGVSNPAVNDVLIPNVGAQPTIGVSDIGIFSLNISNGRTLTITNPRVLTIGGSPGGDLTLDGIISGGFLNLGTGTHVINNAGGTGNLSPTNVATVLSGSTVTLNNNLQAGAFAVNAGGSFNITNRTLSLNGSGAALAAAGTFTTTGSTVIFNGSAAQTTGTVYNNLTIN
ncbi:MAG: beta strand repeat-containing protein, partial [Pyrinomonadaceae bacterium]